MKSVLFLCTAVSIILAPHSCLAAGIDVATSGLSRLQTWLNTWIPIGAGLVVMIYGVALLSGRMHWQDAKKPVVGLIIIGSATYIVSMFIS